MVSKFLCIALGAAAILVVPWGGDMSGLGGNGAARAEAGGGVEQPTTRPKAPGAPKKAQPDKKKTGKKKKEVAVHADYTQSKLRKVRDVQSKLAGYAKADKLKGLATNRKRLENFTGQIDAMGAAYTGWKSVEFNKILLQLKRYSTQKKDKALRKWAGGILAAFAAFDALDLAEAKRAKVKKAIAGKNPLTEAFGRAEYSDARGDYHRAVKKLPPEMRKLFTPMPKDPAK